MNSTDVLVIGAGAAGLMCAIEAAKRGRSVTVLEHARKPGNKIRMAGGGKCNFTNYEVSAENFLSHNRHFVKSALSRYTQWDFLALVQDYQIPFHERDHGQLFCNDSSKDILDMLLQECEQAGVKILLKTEVVSVKTSDAGKYIVQGVHEKWQCESLVVATGGLSIPTAGATPLGYKIAEQYHVKVWPPSAGLVPFTLQPDDKSMYAALSGIAVDAQVNCNGQGFRENVLFTHRGLSGPAILQISNYWYPGDIVEVDWLPDTNLNQALEESIQTHPKQQLKTFLAQWLPHRLVAVLLEDSMAMTPLNQLNVDAISRVTDQVKNWKIKPGGTEGYRVAEVTRGGVDCDAISSRTMEASNHAGLYFIGEVLDVTGWLGGYNLQWAWSSGWCAGQFV